MNRNLGFAFLWQRPGSDARFYVSYFEHYSSFQGQKMDMYIRGYNSSKNYYSVMAGIEATKLPNTARKVSNYHIQDMLTRMRFLDEIKKFTQIQMKAIEMSSDNEWVCKNKIKTIRDEENSLRIQDRMLRTGEAKLTAAIHIYHENKKVIGYIIQGVGIVIGSLQVVGGMGIIAGSVAHGNIIGVIAGATVMVHGFGNISESMRYGNFVRDGYEDTAFFFGFDKSVGTLAYNTVNLSTSLYGLARSTLNPESWRLFIYMPTDFIRKVNGMSNTALAIESVKSTIHGIKIGNSLFEVTNSN